MENRPKAKFREKKQKKYESVGIALMFGGGLRGGFTYRSKDICLIIQYYKITSLVCKHCIGVNPQKRTFN